MSRKGKDIIRRDNELEDEKRAYLRLFPEKLQKKRIQEVKDIIIKRVFREEPWHI